MRMKWMIISAMPLFLLPATGMEEMRPDKDRDQQFDPEEMKGKMDAMMKEHEAAIQAILSDEQYELYQKYREENRPKGPEGGPRGPE